MCLLMDKKATERFKRRKNKIKAYKVVRVTTKDDGLVGESPFYTDKTWPLYKSTIIKHEGEINIIEKMGRTYIYDCLHAYLPPPWGLEDEYILLAIEIDYKHIVGVNKNSSQIAFTACTTIPIFEPPKIREGILK